jgi:hypothetical protein
MHWLSIIITLPLLALALSAQAAEVCVVCSEPGAVYRCIADPKLPAFRGSDKVLQYICVTELAKTGSHASCRVANEMTAGCLGIERIVGSQGVEPPSQPAAGAPVDAAAPIAEQPKEKPPQTLVELAKRTKEQVDEDTRKTGQAVGGAFKKSWDCLTTLFSKC